MAIRAGLTAGILAAMAFVAPPLLGSDSPAEVPKALDNCNVVWNSPSTGANGSMPLGNGEVGVNLWVERDGDLLFYIAHRRLERVLPTAKTGTGSRVNGAKPVRGRSAVPSDARSSQWLRGHFRRFGVAARVRRPQCRSST